MDKKVWLLTGGIASGKTLVSKWFAEEGAYIISCDMLARAAREEQKQMVQAEFGTSDPRALRSLLFGQPLMLAKLEAMILPEVIRQVQDRINQQNYSLMVVEVPLLSKEFAVPFWQGTITVETPIESRIRRLMSRDNISAELACQMIGCQPAEADRLNLATVVFKNERDIDYLKAQVDVFLSIVLKKGV